MSLYEVRRADDELMFSDEYAAANMRRSCAEPAVLTADDDGLVDVRSM